MLVTIARYVRRSGRYSRRRKVFNPLGVDDPLNLPCARNPERWTSPVDRAEAEAAATGCRTQCPALAACVRYTADWQAYIGFDHALPGVWGGVIRSASFRRPKDSRYTPLDSSVTRERPSLGL